jgi:hypothetical protein
LETSRDISDDIKHDKMGWICSVPFSRRNSQDILDGRKKRLGYLGFDERKTHLLKWILEKWVNCSLLPRQSVQKIYEDTSGTGIIYR